MHAGRRWPRRRGSGVDQVSVPGGAESTWAADPEQWPAAADPPLPPHEDPFFTPPAGWEAAAPGAVLRRRDVSVATMGWIPLRNRAFQLLYRSSDLFGNPVATATTVLVPGRLAECPAVLAYQVAIDAVSPLVFPSYALLNGAQMIGQSAPAELLTAAAGLARGWVVTICDHEGPDGRWLAPRQPGYHVLDAVRATLATNGTGAMPALRADTPVGLWGFSGGGVATAWAAEEAPGYAPELNLVGAMIGSPPSDLSYFAHKLDGHLFGGVLVLVIAALRRAYPAVAALLEAELTTRGREALARAEELTMERAQLRWPFVRLDGFFLRPWRALLAHPDVSAMFADTALGGTAPGCPLYVYQPVLDEFVPAAMTDRLVAAYRACGTSVTYRKDRLSEHFILPITGAPAALAWLQSLLAGEQPRGDTVTQWSTLVSRPARRAARQWLATVPWMWRRPD